jgi:VWFA-related protein
MAFATLAAQEGQAPRDPQDAPPIFRSSTNLIRVDMYATKNGQLVTDLRPDEVDVFEDGIKQKVETFEYVHVNAETTTTAERQNPDRARVFMVFIDTYTTRFTGQPELRTALLRLLDQLLLPNDLVGLMTSEMAAPDVVLGRRGTVISDLANDERWSQRTPADRVDAKEYAWENCYGNRDPRLGEMKKRSRARTTLEALQDLTAYLGGLREERKAVLLVTGGWYFLEATPESLAGDEERMRRGETSACASDWRALQRIDYDRLVTKVGRSANRANVSFYPVNFRAAGGNRNGQNRNYSNRFGSSSFNRMRTGAEEQLEHLAEATDGLAEIGAQNLEQVTERIARDTSSYYLLSYQLPAWRADTAYHSITVKVRRPGVTVRSRSGYGGETVRFVKLDKAPVSTRPVLDSRIASAFEGVQRFESLSPVWLRTSGFTTSLEAQGGAFWVVGEAGANTKALKSGTAEVIVTTPDKRQVLSQTVNLTGTEVFDARVPETGTLPFGTYGVRVRIRGTDEAGSVMVQDLPRIELAAAAGGLGEPILWRRGPLVRDSYQQTADPRFRRTERLRLEYATDVSDEATARLLDRTGQPLQVPVQLTTRSGPESSGVRWIVADLPLTAFAPGDYAVSLSQRDRTQVTAFRIIP